MGAEARHMVCEKQRGGYNILTAVDEHGVWVRDGPYFVNANADEMHRHRPGTEAAQTIWQLHSTPKVPAEKEDAGLLS